MSDDGYYDDGGDYGDEGYYDEGFSDGYQEQMDEDNDLHLKMNKKKSSKKDHAMAPENALKKGTSVKYESKRFKNVEGQTFILQNEIFDQLMIKIQQEVVELVYRDVDDCILIFHEFGWSMQKMQNKYFSDQDKVFKELGFDKEEKYYEESKKKGQLKETFRSGKEELCGLCFCDSDVIATCKQGHTFCTDCWGGYIDQKLNEKNPFFRCMMEGCNSYIRHSFIIQILSHNESDKSNSKKDTYKKFLGMSYVEENKNIQYCPGKNCIYAAEKMDGIPATSFKCLCGTNFCFKCQQISHYPCTCKQHREFNEMLNRDDANLLWIINNAKLCPYCNRAVERSMGCNYIRCSPPCNKSFCYICEKPWLDDADGTHHKSPHMNCNNYAADQSSDKLTEKDKQQKMLEKCSFYVGKFKDCMRSIEVINKKKEELVEKTRLTLSNQLGIQFLDSVFIEDAFNILLESRLTLQWSYAFAYYFTVDQVKSKMLFEDLQMQFAGYCESLAILLSSNFIDYTKLIEKTDFSKNFPPELLTKYQDFKLKISKLSNAIKTNSASLIESVENGSVFID